MSYITQANALRIVTKSLNCISSNLEGEIYEPMKIHFFNKWEEQQILAIKYLFENPSEYFNEIYDKIIPTDSYNYIYEGNIPCFHKESDCRFINSDMVNYRIPDDIKAKGKKTVDDFREWFKSVEYLLNNNKIDIFEMRLLSRWGINTNIKSIIIENSGIEEQENMYIGELEKKN